MIIPKANPMTNSNRHMDETLVSVLNESSMLAEQMRQTVVNKRGIHEYFNSKGINLQRNYVESGNFPFGMEVSSSITDLQLNEKRVAAMGKILQQRTLQRMP